MPEKTRSEFRDDGFFVTGDVGRIDERGYDEPPRNSMGKVQKTLLQERFRTAFE